MSLTEKTVYEITTDANEHVHVREIRIIMDNGVEIQRLSHREVITPGEDYAAKPKRVRKVCQTLHTPQAVSRQQSKNALDEKEQNASIWTGRLESAQREYDGNPTPETLANLETTQAAFDAAAAARDTARLDFNTKDADYEASIV